MARIHRDEVERIAELARLRLAPGEAESLTADLAAILDHVAQLTEVDTEGIEPSAHDVPPATPLREDCVEPSLDPEQAVANAPARAGTAFAVPAVLEDEG